MKSAATDLPQYDMLTSPITSPHFQSRVLTLLSSSLSQATSRVEDITKTKNASPVVIPPLTPADTPLTPDDSISQIIGISSSWIDLTSPDPIVADISRQVLNLELAYAAFCGITYLLIPGPNLRGHGVSDSAIAQYARAIMDALSQAPYIQIYIWQSILDHSEEQIKDMGDLSAFARPQFLNDEDLEQQGRLDLFGTWEAWDIIRSICKYHARLGVGKHIDFSSLIIMSPKSRMSPNSTLPMPPFETDDISSSIDTETTPPCGYSIKVVL